MGYGFTHRYRPHTMLICCSVGRYTVPFGLIVLLLVAMHVGPTDEAFIAWLPLYATTIGIITTSLAHIWEQAFPARNCSSSRENGNTASSLGNMTGQQQESPQMSVMARWISEPLQPVARHMLGQDYHQVPQSEVSATTLSLSSTGQVRSSWGSLVNSFWTNPLSSFHNRDL